MNNISKKLSALETWLESYKYVGQDLCHRTSSSQPDQDCPRWGVAEILAVFLGSRDQWRWQVIMPGINSPASGDKETLDTTRRAFKRPLGWESHKVPGSGSWEDWAQELSCLTYPGPTPFPCLFPWVLGVRPELWACSGRKEASQPGPPCRVAALLRLLRRRPGHDWAQKSNACQLCSAGQLCFPLEVVDSVGLVTRARQPHIS